MRILSFILAILFFGISTLPCTDNENAGQEVAEVEVHVHASDVSGDHSHSDHEDHTDGCSPFCTCSCCGVAITMPPVVNTEFSLLPARIEHTAIWLGDNSFAYLTSVWQPPASC